MIDINTISRTASYNPSAADIVNSASRNNTDFTSALNQRLGVPANLDPIFEEASRRYNVPASLLKAVAKAESDFNPNAVSHAGAQGIMQLMPATARSLGVTDSFDPRQNIMGGAKYLSDALRKYDGNVKLALAAYNAGGNNVDKYNGVPPFKETQQYVVKVMNYAQTGERISTPRSTPSDSGSRFSYNGAPIAADSFYGGGDYYEVLDSILNFDDFTTDDYLLFLEMLKSNLGTSDYSYNSGADSFYQTVLMSNRIKMMF